MGDVPNISPEQLREASARMAGMSPDDLARAADLAQAQQMRNGPSATAQPAPSPGQGAQESLPGMCNMLIVHVHVHTYVQGEDATAGARDVGDGGRSGLQPAGAWWVLQMESGLHC